jgi:SH3-like domain-containing protein
MKSIALFLLICILSILLVSCRGKKREQTIQLPSTSVLTIRSNWGVVKSNYLRMRTEPSKSAAVLDGLTKGTVVEVLSSTEKEETIENETSYWFRIDMEGLKGWIFGAYLEILDSKSKAEAYARELK